MRTIIVFGLLALAGCEDPAVRAVKDACLGGDQSACATWQAGYEQSQATAAALAERPLIVSTPVPIPVAPRPAFTHCAPAPGGQMNCYGY